MSQMSLAYWQGYIFDRSHMSQALKPLSLTARQ